MDDNNLTLIDKRKLNHIETIPKQFVFTVYKLIGLISKCVQSFINSTHVEYEYIYVIYDLIKK